MTVSDLAKTLGCEVISGSDETLGREVVGAYSGDLLSWVMGRARAHSVWITIMSNINVAAVAELTDVSCVVLAEGVNPDNQLLERAKREELPLLTSEMPAYELCWRVKNVIS